MERSGKLLAAMQGVGVFVVDLRKGGVTPGLKDGLVVDILLGEGEVYFAGTGKGLYKSTDGGRTWRLKGLEEYKVYSLAVHPQNPSVVYAGTEPPFLFRSADGGESWSELEGVRKLPGRGKWSYPPPPHIAHIKGIAIHPEDPEIIYLSIEEGGVIRSLDAGEAWRYVSKGEAETFRSVSRVTGVYQDCHVVRLSPHDPDIVFVSTGDGLYRSPDCGKSWMRVDRGYATKKYFGPICIHPKKPNVVYTVASVGPPMEPNNYSSVYKSTDGGFTFEEIELRSSKPLHIVGWNGLVIDPLDPAQLYFGTAEGELYGSADAGEGWKRLPVDLPKGKMRTLMCAP